MSQGPDVAAINKALQGATELLGFELHKEGKAYVLKLTVARKGAAPAMSLVCRDVQNLELNPTGDGFERMLKLQLEDLRDDGLDRIRFSVEEVERETLFLHCAEVELV